ncbi:hypothetical protein O6H91_06G033300 [Diphasiastrum complanatum]|uniref:Uncharacterized protein n=2 Tax=Diphasiastrum complanatum TaxID=34168 RepID=A0ACC2DCM5_DIPCM|nr:hypothetical protein O6H91_Y486000 [Diphasiastrum complanatum]KAJ7551884.1 hypothetical protein O6H91_06G033300 [Diphasiastrum complanatum]KAJ7551885.1 hypothetical protein O6H91_06G033300 [Diphasiastrum complanatum]
MAFTAGRSLVVFEFSFLVVVVVVGLVHAKDTNPIFSPCGDTKVQKSDGFTFGLVFNSNDSFFSGRYQLSPCDRRLNLYSGRIASFRPKVDEISLLSVNDSSFNPAEAGGFMVAFAGSKFAAKSPPHFVADNTYIVTSFSLVLNFDKGRLINMLWKDDGCKSCEGKTSFVCLKKQDCAIRTSSCKTNGGKVDCSLSIQVTFSGTDQHDEVMNSWYQINSLHQYSLYNLYSNLKGSLTSQYNNFF